MMLPSTNSSLVLSIDNGDFDFECKPQVIVFAALQTFILYAFGINLLEFCRNSHSVGLFLLRLLLGILRHLLRDSYN